VVIEVGEWGDAAGVGGLVVDDDGEPEPEFAEPDGHWSDIDAEDRVCEDVPPDGRESSVVAEVLVEGGEPFEGCDEEAAGAAGRVEDPERGHRRAEVGGVGGGDVVTGERGADQIVWCADRVGQRIIDQGRHEGCRRVEGAGAAAQGCVHE
jgi:hypothetical protein